MSELDQPFSYQELRSLAEYASSVRGRQVYFFRRGDAWEFVDDPARAPTGATLVPVYNPPLPEHPSVQHAVIQARAPSGRKVSVDVMHLVDPRSGKRVRADAAFWSEAAVEKFLVPYYASVSGDQAEGVVGTLLDVLDSLRQGVLGGREGEGEGGEAFALAHIPRSEYVTVGSGMVVLVHDEGEHGYAPLTLAEYAERHSRKRGRKSGSRST